MAASESNPTYLIIGIVTFIVAAFLIGNVVAYQYAQKIYPPKPKKKLGAKQMKRERLKQGLRPAGGD